MRRPAKSMYWLPEPVTTSRPAGSILPSPSRSPSGSSPVSAAKLVAKLTTGSGCVAPERVAIFSSTTTEDASRSKTPGVPTNPT
jgi:hypothetical protein